MKERISATTLFDMMVGLDLVLQKHGFERDEIEDIVTTWADGCQTAFVEVEGDAIELLGHALEVSDALDVLC